MKVNYEELKKELLVEHNKIRSDPVSYIPHLENQMKYFRKDILYRPKETAIQTNEGKAAYLEAIQFLKHQVPLKALTFDTKLSKVCQEHANDLGLRGLVSHESSDGRTLIERFDKYFEWDGSCCENIDVGNKLAVSTIISLLVDDGILDRPHRKNMFNLDMQFIGIGCCEHKDYDVITVIDYIENMRPLGQPFYDPSNLKYQYPKNVNSLAAQKKKPKKDKDSNIVNQYQIDDPDAPENTISLNIVKSIKTYEGKARKITKKIYTLENGTKHIIEIEEF